MNPGAVQRASPERSVAHANPAGQSSSRAHAVAQIASRAIGPSPCASGSAAAAATIGSSHACSPPTSALSANCAHAASPYEVTPAITSPPTPVHRTGPPLSPVQVIAGAGVISKWPAPTVETWAAPVRFTPGAPPIAASP